MRKRLNPSVGCLLSVHLKSFVFFVHFVVKSVSDTAQQEF